ncbi:polyamine ABC transporter ATP-binding protein [Rhodococcus sp. ACS1]|uniref:ABC transporter ATP-binding protein n=1 Tax=Rhodococcus sp. ACS1 TaxID=2028570 RepID=UPI000BB13B06|nr:ABC transporter ATP-binding protein [Rhodococcus sp. ACS1]PBC39550.1 polyamine ABC transporter ATP-binding protein [Rhodococcus sp. ACS1]
MTTTDHRIPKHNNAAAKRSRKSGAAVPSDTKLQLKNLNKSYGGSQVVYDVSLDVASNELITLLGPSGSGKTTTMMMIAGFVTPDSGDIVMDGESITVVPPYQRNIGVVFQNYALFPHMSVSANVEFPLRQRGVSRAAARSRAEEFLELVGLAGYGSRRIPQLSGGQQQRVALARALVFDPPLLIMDEPLSALDKRLREQMQEEIKRIQQAVGVTVLCVTHDQTEAFVLSDRIAVMNEGRILQVGHPREVYERPADSFVAEFLGESNLIRGRVGPEQQGGRVFHTIYGFDLCVERDTPESATAILVRPERAELHRAGEQPEQVFAATPTIHGSILTASFVGSSMVYRVDCDGLEFTVRQPAGGSTPFTPRDAVVLGIHASACAPIQF